MHEERKRVFLSHSSQNQEAVSVAAKFLESRNIPCWFSPREIKPGTKYYEEIIHDLEHKVAAVVVFLSHEIGRSEWVPKEVDRAIYYHKPIIPVQLDDSAVPKSLELSLCDLQRINLDEAGLERLAEALEDIYQSRSTLSWKESGTHDFSRMNEPVMLKNQSRVLLYRINPKVMERVRGIFVAPEAFDEAVRVLQREHIACLYNANPTGKYTAAVAALLNTKADEWYETAMDTTWQELIRHPLKTNMGIVFHLEDGGKASPIPEHELQRFIDKLKEKQAFLVLVSKTPPTPGMLSRKAFRLDAPADRRLLFTRHAEHLDADETVKQSIFDWLCGPDAGELMKKPMLPRDGADFIDKLSSFFQGELPLEHLEASLTTGVKERVSGWLQRNPSIQDLCFYLALSLFEGERASDIRAYSTVLLRLLQPGALPDTENPAHLKSIDDYMNEFQAYLQTEWESSYSGLDKKEGLRFIFPEDRLFIWEHLWRQYDPYHEALIAWIKGAVAEQSVLHEQVLPILVRIAAIDFTSVRDRFVHPWANSSATHERWLAALLLEQLAEDDQHGHKVFNIVKAWIGYRNNTRLQWTAVVLLGGWLGVGHFPQALRLLKAASSSEILLYPAQKSMHHLSRLALRITEFEDIYFSFWEEWFGESDKADMRAIRYAQAVFLQEPKLFFQTVKERNMFWTQYLALLYTEPTDHALVRKWASYALNDERYERYLSNVLNRVLQTGNETSRSRLRSFMEMELQRPDQPLYLNRYVLTGRKSDE